MLIQVSNKPTIDVLCGAIAYATCRGLKTIYCDNVMLSKPVKELIKDYSLPLGVKVINNEQDLPVNELDKIALLGLDIHDWEEYTAVRQAGGYFFIDNKRGKSMATPPSLRLETQSFCSLVYESYYKRVASSLTDPVRRKILDLLYLGLSQATDRFQSQLDQLSIRHKRELEDAKVNTQMTARYLRYTLSPNEMMKILKDTSETAICGPNDEVAIVATSSNNESAMRLAMDLLESLDTITIVVVCSASDSIPGTYNVLVKSLDKFYSADSIINLLSDKEDVVRRNVFTISSKFVFTPQCQTVDSFVEYIKGKVDNLYSTTELLEDSLPNSTFRLAQRLPYTTRILDIMQLANIPDPDVKVITKTGIEIESVSRYWEMMSDGVLYPISKETLEQLYVKDTQEVFSICDETCLDASYSLVVQISGLNTYLDREMIRQLRTYKAKPQLNQVKTYTLQKPTRLLTRDGNLLHGNPGDYLVENEYGEYKIYYQKDFDKYFRFQ